MSGPRILVFGSSGQVARELKRARWDRGADVTFLDRAAADLSAPERLGPIVRRTMPDLVIIAAAYTAVDGAESEESLAMTVNAHGPAAIARAAAELSAPLIHLSTDYVFDGEKDGFYGEEDRTNPINAYGRSKLAGEAAVRAANPRHIILRTSWVYSAGGANFLRTMLRLAATREEVRVVADQRGCPTAAPHLAQAVAMLAPQLMGQAPIWGTYHLSGQTQTSWHGFAEGIFAGLAKRAIRRPRNIAVTTDEFPTPARRPLNSRLSCERSKAAFGLSLPGWEEALPQVMDEILAHA